MLQISLSELVVLLIRVQLSQYEDIKISKLPHKSVLCHAL